MKKVLMLATTAAMIEQFNKENICLLNEMGYTVDMVGNFNVGNPISNERLEAFKTWMKERRGKCFEYSAKRNLLAVGSNLSAIICVKKIISSNEYEFIHCHTPIGAVIGRVAGHFNGTKVIYTAHGFHFYKGSSCIAWLLFYPIEKILSRWTDVIILITKEDYQIARNKFKASKIFYIPGIGVDTIKWKYNYELRIAKRRELNLRDEEVAFFSVGELNKNKNHKYVIEALYLMANPKVHYYVVGKGNMRNDLEQLAISYGISEQVHLLGFRDDVYQLLHAADVFILPSKREGISVSLMEAMSLGVACVASDIRGNRDLLEDISGALFDLDNIKKLVEIMETYLLPEVRKKNGKEAKKNIQNFSKDIVRQKMHDVYSCIK